MGFKERIRKIMGELYTRKESGDTLTEEGLIIIIEDKQNVNEQTAKDYIKDILRRDLLEETSAMTYEILPKQEIPDTWLPDGGEE